MLPCSEIPSGWLGRRYHIHTGHLWDCFIQVIYTYSSALSELLFDNIPYEHIPLCGVRILICNYWNLLRHIARHAVGLMCIKYVDLWWLHVVYVALHVISKVLAVYTVDSVLFIIYIAFALFVNLHQFVWMFFLIIIISIVTYGCFTWNKLLLTYLLYKQLVHHHNSSCMSFYFCF